jgi:hypothetical protein
MLKVQPDVHFSKILIRPFIFRKSSQNKYKNNSKFQAHGQGVGAGWS